MTAAVLGGGGWAVQQALASAAGNPAGGQKMWIALGAMAAVGLVVGLVVAGRVSPLATFVPSMVLLAWTVVYSLDMNRALSLIPDEPSVNQIIRDVGFGDKTMLTTGFFALLGVAMFIPVLIPSRWARRDEDLEEDYEESPQSSYY
ncbi:hypothetical protein [Nonomuraea guangzhouensis]|uniref:Uncharacterized protein n=1 Tax=Nonomuraea guangzhouensis TaxID=1291555 RepID=A0ABW4GD90_9ACTN|nr:hypothetical protein [Nonomuraea guangzhouensis]